MPIDLKKRKISRKAYHLLAEGGMFEEGAKIELLNGEIIDISPIGSRHIGTVNWLTHFFSQELHGKAIISVQNPISLGEYSEPEPDIILCRYREDFYRNSIATPEDVILVVEVSDTTLEKDKFVKLPLYAEAGIPNVWIVNLEDALLEVYSDPQNGKFNTVNILNGEDTYFFEALDLGVSVKELLGY